MYHTVGIMRGLAALVLTLCRCCAFRRAQYINEVPGARAVAVDKSATAVATIRDNARLNGVETSAESDLNATGTRLVVAHASAADISQRHARRFFFVDVDPFGAVAPHIDAAVAATRDGGLCSFASFDVGDLSGARPESSAACAAKVRRARVLSCARRCRVLRLIPFMCSAALVHRLTLLMMTTVMMTVVCATVRYVL